LDVFVIFICDQEENSLVLMGSFRHPSSRFFYIFSLMSWALEDPVIPPVDLKAAEVPIDMIGLAI